MSMFACGAVVLVSTAGFAAQYSFTGKFSSNRGKIINIPVVGNTPCQPLILMTGPGNGGTMTPAVHMIIRGANTQPQQMVTTNFTPYKAPAARDLLCVRELRAANKVVPKITTAGATGGGKGGAFVMPPNVWSKPLPPYVRAVEVKYAPPVEQLATSFKITGPAPVRTTPPAGTMGNGGNTAAFHAFKQNAYATQTGRAGKDFVWCPTGDPASGMGAPCTNINQGGPNLIVKYTHGTNSFGGTMAYIITTGSKTSSLGIGVGGGAVGFQVLAGMGSQPTGRGYAEFLTDHLIKGPVWGVHTRMTVTPGPIVGPQKLITMVAFPAGTFPSGTNFNFGFPLTTGKVLVRNYFTRTTTLTAQGYDKRGTPTAMGKRNLSLVAGGLAIARLVGAADQMTPEIMTMLLPEPGATLQILAGVGSLLGIAVWRARRSR
jgi:hypothetical protein